MAKVYKIAVDAGHGRNTIGKRTPAGEREWTFNNAVVVALMGELKNYENVQVLRLDDPTGNTDVPINTRVRKANDWGADVVVSVHQNASKGVWGNHTGAETYVYSTKSVEANKLAKAVQPKLAKAMGITDRGIRVGNFGIIRDSNAPAILTEGGFMDSNIDVLKLRDQNFLRAQGVSIATGVAEYLNLTKRPVQKGGDGVANLTPEQEAVRQEAMRLKITDGNHPLREVNQYYVWNALIPMMKRIIELEADVAALKARS